MSRTGATVNLSTFAGSLTANSAQQTPTALASLLQPPLPITAGVQQVLLKASSAPFLTSRIANALAEDDGAGDILEDLYRRSLFVQRKPAAAPLYQLHALFREFLQTRAASLDRDGRVLVWSPGAERMTGYAAGEIAGRIFGFADLIGSGASDAPNVTVLA